MKKRWKESDKRTATDIFDSFALMVEKGTGPSRRTDHGEEKGKGVSQSIQRFEIIYDISSDDNSVFVPFD